MKMSEEQCSDLLPRATPFGGTTAVLSLCRIDGSAGEDGLARPIDITSEPVAPELTPSPLVRGCTSDTSQSAQVLAVALTADLVEHTHVAA